MQQTKQLFYFLAFFFLLLVTVFFLRLPVFSNSFCDPDLADPAYAARLYLDGECPYLHSVVTKPPGSVLIYTLLFAAAKPQMIYVHLFAALLTFLACVVLYVILARHNREAGYLAAGLYAFSQAELVAAGPCANFETWVILPALVTLAFVTRPAGGRARWSYFAAGLAAGLAFWMKQPAILFVGAAAGLIAWRTATEPGPGRRIGAVAGGLGAFGLGLLAVTAVVLLWLRSAACVGAVFDIMNPLKMKGYLGSVDFAHRCLMFWDIEIRFVRSNPGLVLMTIAGVALVFGAMRLRLRGPARTYASGLVFLVTAILFVYAGGRFFGHYLVVMIPFFCLVAAMGYEVIAVHQSGRRRAAIAAAILLGVVFGQQNEIGLAGMSAASLVRTGSVMSNDIFYTNTNGVFEPGRSNQLISYLEWQALYAQVAGYIRRHQRPGDTIWTLDYIPDLYHYTDTFAPTRQHNNFEFVVQSKTGYYGLWHGAVDARVTANRTELMHDLRSKPPRFIIRYRYDCPSGLTVQLRMKSNWPRNAYGSRAAVCYERVTPFADLRDFLDRNYRIVEPPINNGVDVYEYVGPPVGGKDAP